MPKKKNVLSFLKKAAFAGGGVAVAASPALAVGAGDYTDVTGYATTNIPLAVTAIIALFLLFMALPLAKRVYREVTSLIAGH